MYRYFNDSIVPKVAAWALGCYISGLASVTGELIYDVSFENPPHTNGAPVTVGIGSDRASYEVDAYIGSGISGFSSQVAFTTNAGEVGMYAPSMSTTGIHLLSWEYALLSTTGGVFQSAAGILGNAGSLAEFRYFTQGTNMDIRLYLNGSESATIAQFAFGRVDDFAVSVNLDNNYLDLAINGIPTLTGVAIDPSKDIERLFFGTSAQADPVWAVDNVRWEIVPEPSTNVLMALGAAVAAAGSVLRRARNAAHMPTNLGAVTETTGRKNP